MRVCVYMYMYVCAYVCVYTYIGSKEKNSIFYHFSIYKYLDEIIKYVVYFFLVRLMLNERWKYDRISSYQSRYLCFLKENASWERY